MAVNPISSDGRFYDDIGVWARVPVNPPASPPRPALFLDRDGVILEDPGYLCRTADMVVIDGAAEIISAANRKGIPVVEVTNQAGIGRGYYGWEEFLEVERALTSELARAGAFINATFACPYHSHGTALWTHPAHPARKPRPGMLLAAERFLNVDLNRSWIVGDKSGDLIAGRNAGLRGGLHVLTGHGTKHRQDATEWSNTEFEVRLGDSIRDAFAIIELLNVAGCGRFPKAVQSC
jgi:D-glycero-D-manno-heptose 1,7-bisphosphate phosphatase